MAAPLSEPPVAQTPCQFSGETCSTESNHYRKVISHIFGRNKKCTVGIPQYVWIYYCRKHYQRARYRTVEWPFRQCDLAIDTIQNMRAWGGVESFNLQLRRRETWRTARQADENDTDGENDKANQDIDMSYVKSEDHESSKSSPNTGTRTFTPINGYPHTIPSAKAEESGYDGDEEGRNKNPVDTTAATRKGVKMKTPKKKNKKRPPTIIPHPVPGWLHTRVGSNKTFDEILSVLHDLRTHLTQVAHREQTPHFPDIEILPNLRPRAGPRRTIRRATRPTLRPLLPLVDAPTTSIGPILSTSTKDLTKRCAASLTFRHPPSPIESATDLTAEISDNDASNVSIKFAIRHAARFTNINRRTSRLSGHGAIKKMNKK